MIDSLSCLHGFSLVAQEWGLTALSCGVVVSLVPEHGLCTHGLIVLSLWDFHGAGMEPASPALAWILYHWAPREAQDLQFWSNASQSSVIHCQSAGVSSDIPQGSAQLSTCNSDEGVKALNTTSINCLKLGHTCRHNKTAESIGYTHSSKEEIHAQLKWL